jgi:hypothetical protein
VFKVKEVHVKVDLVKFSIRDSKHDLLYKTLRPLAALVKRQVQKALRDAMHTGLEYFDDGQLVGVRDRVEEAKRKKETGCL